MAKTLANSIGGTVRQRAERELRDRILTGALRPGARLDLDEISAEFGISRTPVREALLELSFQGLVEIAPRSGVKVIGVSPEATVDNFAILATLSGKAAEWAADRITPDDIARLEELASARDSAAQDHGLVDLNWRFHRIINEASRSPHLLSLIRQAVRLIPSNYLEVIPMHDQSGEHDELLRALRDGRARQARDVAERHVLSAGVSLAEWLSENPGTAE
ncbi:GntR family transcriptional regulator [Yinghuangia sp. ASG 101]|uniref:GntR family transcriptional regulator n=1 Tax=Yinghuangia sp. ASG 101 TaxID=2896848 RepID=UPI001E5F6445|nr:GntR family transcriptional regulator [Yinghuangia sp. ASG 101]UGQ15058.1 GntR family transcriptional regulator [Yinghuangia sp. ASG 101]